MKTRKHTLEAKQARLSRQLAWWDKFDLTLAVSLIVATLAGLCLTDWSLALGVIVMAASGCATIAWLMWPPHLQTRLSEVQRELDLETATETILAMLPGMRAIKRRR
jgi:hypothetical protein